MRKQEETPGDSWGIYRGEETKERINIYVKKNKGLIAKRG